MVRERPGVGVSEIAAVTKIGRTTVAATVSKLKRSGELVGEAGGVRLQRAGDGESATEQEAGALVK